MKPRSNCIPSVYSFSIARPRPSSTVITPSLPTLSITSAINAPISGSAAEIAATCAISSCVSTGLLIAFISAMTASVPFSRPLRRIIGFAPAARFFSPSTIIAWASTVAVVVPSPATSFVFVAASVSNCAPIFSKGSGRSISRAIVTPSFVIVGAPNFLSSTTLRPLGPIVTLSVSARASIPFLSECRACSVNCSLFATKYTPQCSLRASKNRATARVAPTQQRYVGSARHTLPSPCKLALSNTKLFNNTHDIAFAQDQILFTVDFDFAASVLCKQHLLSDAHLKLRAFAIIEHLTRTHGQYFALLWLLFRRIRQHNAAFSHRFAGQRLDHYPVTERSKLDTHCCHMPIPPYMYFLSLQRGRLSLPLLALQSRECEPALSYTIG